MKKNIIRLNENQLRYMINEAVKRVLKEGLASPSLKRLAKEHGGIRYVDPSLQLDKLNADFSQKFFQENFLVTKGLFGMKKIIGQFFDDEPIIRFRDGMNVYKVKDEYMNDKKVKDLIAQYRESSSQLRDRRNADVESGHGEEWETDDDGRNRHYEYSISPESMRQAKHNDSRGVKKPEAKGSDKDYDKYVENYLLKKYDGKIKHFPDYKTGEYTEKAIVVPKPKGEIPSNGYLDRGPLADMFKEFKKYGYGYDEQLSWNFSKYSDIGKVYVFRKGMQVDMAEIDDKYMYPDYFMPVASKVESPKIGTKAYNDRGNDIGLFDYGERI